MRALALLVVFVSYLLAKTSCEQASEAAICYRTVGYRYIASRLFNNSACCNDLCPGPCDREGPPMVEYYIATQYVQEFGCCNGYYQPDTQAAICIPLLLQVNYTTPNPDTLILTWSPPDPSYRNGVVRGYLVVISELETSQTLYFNTSTPPLSIPSLHPFYTYNCSVSAYTVGLPGPYSPPYLVRMPQSVPTSPPLNLSVVASTSTSVTLSWTPPPTQYQNGVIMGYTLQVFNTQQSLLREINISSNGSTVNSLLPFTTYLFRVAAMTVVGRGPISVYTSVTTLLSAPIIFPEVYLSPRLSAEAIFLSWEPMTLDVTQGALIGYSVRYRPTTAIAKRDTNQDYTTISTTETQITITTLNPTSAYMVGVAAVTQAGIGVYSQNTVELYENSLFQVYMQAPGVVCKEWRSYSATEKTKDIVNQTSLNLGSSFPITYIGDVSLLCDKQQPSWVVLTGRAVGTSNLNSSGMVHQLQEWVLTSPKVTSQGVMLQVLASCPVFLAQLRSPGCTAAMATIPSPTPPVISTTLDTTELTSVVSISVGIGGVLLVLALVVMAIVLYVRRKTAAVFAVGSKAAGANHHDLMLKRCDALVKENQYASIENVATTHIHVTDSQTDYQRTDQSCPAQGPPPTVTAADGCGLDHAIADVTPHNPERAPEGADARQCDDHEGAEDYVEMSCGGSVRDSIYLGGSQNTSQ